MKVSTKRRSTTLLNLLVSAALVVLSAPASAAPKEDLSLTLVDTADPIAVGERTTYSFTVTNKGAWASNDVQTYLTLPSEVAFESATPGQGSCSGWETRVECQLGSLARGASVVIDVVVRAQDAGSATATATVRSSRNDSYPQDNSARETTKITAPAPTEMVSITFGLAAHTYKTGSKQVRECALTVLEQSDGVAALDEAVRSGCIRSYELSYWEDGAYVQSIDGISGYWINLDWTIASSRWAFTMDNESGWPWRGDIRTYRAIEGGSLVFHYSVDCWFLVVGC